MIRLVMKFGGTSVANIPAMMRSARHVQKEVRMGHHVLAVVVSAMAGETQNLRKKADDIKTFLQEHDNSIDYHQWMAERDVLLTTGEQESTALMAILLRSLHIPGMSFQGWQVPILTDAIHGNASPDIHSSTSVPPYDASVVPVVSGFQGVSSSKRITTLGKGGSDLTAIVLAKIWKADRCDIYTDVAGLKTAHPQIVPKAETIPFLQYEEMLEMASQGANILQTRAARFAMEHNIPLILRSSLEEPDEDTEKNANLITSISKYDAPQNDTQKISKGQQQVPAKVVTGIAHTVNDCRITLTRLQDQPGIAALVFAILAEHHINVDMIAQVSHEEGHAHLSFTVEAQDQKKSIAVLYASQDRLKFSSIEEENPVGRISVVGIGMKDTPGVAATMFRTLADEKINIQVIATSEIKISVLVDAKSVLRAIRVLHKAYFSNEA